MVLNSSWRGALLVGLSGMLFGWMSFLGTRLFEYHLSVENLLFWRFLIASLWIAASIFYCRKKTTRPVRLTFPLMKTFLLSAIAYSAGSTFYFLSLKHISTGMAMTIFFSFPVFVALLAWISGSWKMNLIALIALLAVISGLILLKGRGETALDNAGILLAMLGGFSFGVYIFGNQHMTKEDDSLWLTLSVCLGNTLIFLAWSCYTKTFVVPMAGYAWFYICAIGIVATALPIQLLLEGLKYLSPVKASILSVLEPVVTVLIGFVFLHESMTAAQLLGGMVVLSGAVLIQFEGKQHDIK
jgi:drug/metabolite transporter (DMT)-like permease